MPLVGISSSLFVLMLCYLLTVKPSVSLGALRSGQISIELSISRDYSMVCHLDTLRVSLDYHVTLSPDPDTIITTVFYNQTSMTDRVILGGLTPYQSYNISLRAAPSLDHGRTPSLFSSALHTHVTTLKDGRSLHFKRIILY